MSGVLSNLWRDFHYAARRLRASPGFMATAVLTIALGVGVNTALFSVLNGIALRELPVPQSDDLVSIHQILDETTGRQRLRTGPASNFSIPEYRTYRDNAQTLSGVMGYSQQTRVTIGEDAPQQSVGTLVTCNYFDVLQQPPALGAGFARDCDAPSAARTVVLGHDLWTNAFGADPEIIGREVLLDRDPFTVVGIAPEGMRGVDLVAVSWFAPVSAQPLLFPLGADVYDNEDWSWLGLIGRKAADTSLDQVRAELGVIAAQIDRRQPPRETTLDIATARALSGPDNRRQFLADGSIVMAAFGLVLLMACANVANLLLARATGRVREIAVRMSLGASRARVVQQVLAESVSIALIGGILGFILALWTSQILFAFVRDASQAPPLTVDVAFDFGVLAFAFVVTLASGVLFGLAPALAASKTDLHTATKAEATGAGHPSGSRLQRILLGVQVAVCMVLMISAGLLLRGLYVTQTVEPGFDYENVAVASFDFARAGFDAAADAARAGALQRQVAERVASMPGIDAVARVRSTPLGPGGGGFTVRLSGESERVGVRFNVVSPEYFSLIRTPIVRGRTFTETELSDAALTAGPIAVVVTDSTARRLWAGRDPIGRTFSLAVSDAPAAENDETREYTVVGVVRDAEIIEIGEVPSDYIYLPAGTQAILQLVARSRIGFEATVAAFRAATAELDPTLVVQVNPLEANLEIWRRQARVASILSLSLGGLALVLASVGVYGVVAFAVSRRAREIGIRMALGANAHRVLALILKRTMLPVFVGALIGIVITVAVSSALTSFLFGVSPTDPVGIGGAALFVAGVAVVAAVLAARPASRSAPLVALRDE
jgi:predicted permease